MLPFACERKTVLCSCARFGSTFRPAPTCSSLRLQTKVSPSPKRPRGGGYRIAVRFRASIGAFAASRFSSGHFGWYRESEPVEKRKAVAPSEGGQSADKNRFADQKRDAEPAHGFPIPYG